MADKQESRVFVANDGRSFEDNVHQFGQQDFRYVSGVLLVVGRPVSQPHHYLVPAPDEAAAAFFRIFHVMKVIGDMIADAPARALPSMRAGDALHK
jgi:hypothetical protein